jgi:hypothetical protein
MMTRARIILRCARAKYILSEASRRRRNDLGITIKYLRKITSGAAGTT